mgnify:CR=1 FL=1
MWGRNAAAGAVTAVAGTLRRHQHQHAIRITMDQDRSDEGAVWASTSIGLSIRSSAYTSTPKRLRTTSPMRKLTAETPNDKPAISPNRRRNGSSWATAT